MCASVLHVPLSPVHGFIIITSFTFLNLILIGLFCYFTLQFTKNILTSFEFFMLNLKVITYKVAARGCFSFIGMIHQRVDQLSIKLTITCALYFPA